MLYLAGGVYLAAICVTRTMVRRGAVAELHAIQNAAYRRSGRAAGVRRDDRGRRRILRAGRRRRRPVGTQRRVGREKPDGRRRPMGVESGAQRISFGNGPRRVRKGGAIRHRALVLGKPASASRRCLPHSCGNMTKSSRTRIDLSLDSASVRGTSGGQGAENLSARGLDDAPAGTVLANLGETKIRLLSSQAPAIT